MQSSGDTKNVYVMRGVPRHCSTNLFSNLQYDWW